jgi:two-component system nitrate/nitrite response regulator NarP
MPEATPFRVLIVDDHPLMRRGISQLLQLDPAFNVVAEAGDGASAIDLANRLDLDVILLDLNMKGMSGLDTLNALRRDGVTAQIIILTVSDAANDVYALIDAGADGYLLKDSDPEVLLEAIRSGAKGGKAFSTASANICASATCLALRKTHSAFSPNANWMCYMNLLRGCRTNRLHQC